MKANRNNYEVTITETKARSWKKKAFDSTVRFDTKVCDSDSYMMEHSPIRVEEYCVELKGIPLFVASHLVRHGIGVDPFMLSQRDDRNGVDYGRWTPTNHTMFMNAQALINMSKVRLCNKSHKETVYIMNLIKEVMQKKNYILAQFMVPTCVYRNGLCPEGKNTCGKKKSIMKKYSYYKELFV